ncbi:hypothetical protein K3Z85_29415, partial [Pseudomonas aeruginosa]|nr:hypothetical protein [Pseudomonas aeruginosa]
MPTRRRSALPLLALALSLFATLAAAGEPKPARIVSTTPSVTGILLAMDAPLVASAATTPSRLTDAKGFFSQWAKVADQRGVEVLYRNLRFDIEAVIAQDPDLLVASATGADYLDSLRDGRQVYLNGERVADVTRHRAFRNACRSIAGLYDGLHGEQRDVLTRVDAQGRRSHRFFTPAQNAEDLLGAREAIGCWSRMTYGFMGRTPDYKAAFMSGLEAGAGFYGDYRQNACAWHRAFADRGLFLNHAIINPPLDRSKAIHEMRDVFVHVERETDQGIVVSGAKMLATGSAITNATFVAPVASAQMEAGKAEDFAVVFFARMDNPGLRLMCRPSYEERASSPFDYPLSSRFDENDSVLLFDKALIPWEDVLVYRDLRRATGFYAESGFANLYNFQSGIRLGVKLELMIGLLSLGVRANGTQGFRGIQAALGELIALQHLLQALTTAMARDPERNAAGSAVPRLEYANALRIQVPQIWKRVR